MNAIVGPPGGVTAPVARSSMVVGYSVRMFPKLSPGISGVIAAFEPGAEGPEAAVAVATAALPCSKPTPEVEISWEARGVGIIFNTCFVCQVCGAADCDNGVQKN